MPGTVSIIRPTDEQLMAIWEEQSTLPITYKDEAMTQGGVHRGFRHHRASIPLGSGTFDAAKQALRNWAAQRGAGFGVYPERPVSRGQTVLVYGRLGPLYTSACCRVVYVIDDPDRWGFGYGTLPHHAVRGEESFIVAKDKEGNVTFTVESLSRPASPLARLGAPVTRLIQNRMTRRYLEAIRRAVES